VQNNKNTRSNITIKHLSQTKILACAFYSTKAYDTNLVLDSNHVFSDMFQIKLVLRLINSNIYILPCPKTTTNKKNMHNTTNFHILSESNSKCHVYTFLHLPHYTNYFFQFLDNISNLYIVFVSYIYILHILCVF
jgi:hypothetical protein